jgi:mono/diheme cytochrome c family protein
MTRPRAERWVIAVGAVIAILSATAQADRGSAVSPQTIPAHDSDGLPDIIDKHCTSCHNDIDKVANLSLEDLKITDPAQGANNPEWERVLRRVSLGEMPPKSKPQLDPAERNQFTGWLQTSLDARAAAHPDPGRATIRRLNRVEYANAVRDLLDLPVDFSKQLPQDNSGYGFDNIADVLSVSPTLMDRYLVVAGKIARMATGLTSPHPATTVYVVPKDGSIMNSGRPAYNERASDDLPLGSRGGGSFAYDAPYDADYEIAGWLNANTNNETDRQVEDRVRVRVPLKAGAHRIGLSFHRQIAPDETVQTLRNNLDVVPLPITAPHLLTLDVAVDGHRVQQVQVPSYRLSPRYSQANFPRDVLEIDVTGPVGAAAMPSPGDTPSRRRIFICKPSSAAQETPCASRIVEALARRAYRRPVTATDLAPLMRIYAAARADSDFEHGVEAMVEAVLVSPHFLFVNEADPAGAAPGSVHVVSDSDLATRLSLFLWSSIPDDRLLHLAQQGQLARPKVLDAEITRMLADPKAAALTHNFAGQWLFLRNLDQQRPEIAIYPQFDARLRAAMNQETELFFSYVLHDNRSLMDFIAADYTFLNQRLAEHYGIQGVNGTAFRRVELDPATHRGGLLTQASILTVTSYGNRTSVVKRGKWILDNMLAAPPPPPPANVPALQAMHDGRLLTAREQLELHRANPACASCHSRMDPLGFALENFDAVGGFRKTDAGQTIDASAVLPDGTHLTGVSGLQQILLARKDQFAGAFTERLMTYALSRGVGPRDMPSVRKITSTAAADNYRIQTIIKGIVASDAFMLRKVPQQ